MDLKLDLSNLPKVQEKSQGTVVPYTLKLTETQKRKCVELRLFKGIDVPQILRNIIDQLPNP